MRRKPTRKHWKVVLGKQRTSLMGGCLKTEDVYFAETLKISAVVHFKSKKCILTIQLFIISRLLLTFTLHSFHIHVPCAPHSNLIIQICDTYLTDEEIRTQGGEASA